jgi:branched-chain amino acid transport system substrate-binding protein
MKSLRLASVALAAILAGSAGAAAQPAPPFEIDAILGLTGTGAFIAHGQAEALKAAEKYINDGGGIRGRRVRFNVLDSQSSPQIDIQLTTGVLAHHPPIVIDGGPGAVCRGASVLYATGAAVMYCLSPGFYPDRGSYVFGAGIESRVGMSVVVRYLRAAGYKRVGIITMTDIAGQEADAALKSLLADPANRGLTVADAEHFAATDISVDAQMAKIKASNPDVVLGWATGTPTGTLLQGYQDVGLTLPFVASQANQNAKQMEQYHAIMPHALSMYSLMWPAQGTLRNGPLKAAIGAYLRAMKSVGAELGDSSSAEAWDAVMIAANALRKLGTDATPDQIRAYISNLHDYYGPSGRFDFRIGNQRGLDTADTIMVRWDPATTSWQPISAPGGAPLE